ncbi:glutathione S-transferase family protein [Rhizobium sp. KVB221]|uniref:Glutathione S-transferase family protein n=1 Tax=Rhizobium setariae TaxID=2801340 RepID=A0A936YU18_9HYPH|nr:glutathione S-transferase family protein [Rhizobium setariae]MBL0372525.1 glutathione S-transferase family protein [Rhizobium setariae]
MYKLYGSPGSGSASVEAALAEVGAHYSVTRVNTGEGKHLTEDYRAINPRQQVPALELPDGTVMAEGSAMMQHLADAFPESRLAPLPGSSARAQHDRWLIFMAVNMYEGELRKAYPGRYSSDPEGAQAVQASADAYVKRHYEILEQTIGTGPYLFGDAMTMADIYLWMLASWMDQEWLANHCPNVFRLASVVRARPRLQTIHEAHFG